MAYRVKKGRATKRAKKEKLVTASEALDYLMRAGMTEAKAKDAILKILEYGDPTKDYRLTNPETGERLYPVGPDPFGFGPKRH